MASTATFYGVLCYVSKPTMPTTIDKCFYCTRGLLAMTATNDWDTRDVHLTCYERDSGCTKQDYRRMLRCIRGLRFPVVMSANGNLYICFILF